MEEPTYEFVDGVVVMTETVTTTIGTLESLKEQRDTILRNIEEVNERLAKVEELISKAESLEVTEE